MRFASCYIAVCECLREESDLQRLVLEVAEDAAKSGHMVTMVKRWHRAESKRMTWESRPWAWGLWMRWFLSIKFQLLCGFQHFKCNIMQHGSVLQSQSEQYQLRRPCNSTKKPTSEGALWIEPALSIELYADRFGNLALSALGPLGPGVSDDQNFKTSSTVFHSDLVLTL